MFSLKIVSPAGIYDELDVDAITLPTVDGQRTVLPNHMATVLPLEIGVMFYKVKGEKSIFFLSEGLFTFEENEATVVVNTVENQEEIDFNRAERARERAIERLKSHEESSDLRRAELALKRSVTRLSLKK